jgi:flagellin
MLHQTTCHGKQIFGEREYDMSMAINTNGSALNALLGMEKNKTELTSSMQRLSTGLKINKAADDSTGLAIASRMAAQIGSLNQASENAQSGVSLINIADASLGSIAQSLTSLRTLALHAANGTLTSGDRASLNANADAILTQINSVVEQTNYNGLKLIDGSLDTVLQVGTEAGDTIALAAASANTQNIGSVIVTGDPVTDALNAGDLLLNGAAVGASESDGLSFLFPKASAIAIAAAINASGANLQAVANPTVTDVNDFAESTNTGGIITINGVETAPISINERLEENVTNALVAINLLSTQTGVTAAADSDGKLVFTAEDGRNITIAYGSGIENTDLGAVHAGTTQSFVTLDSSSSITVSGNNSSYAGLAGGTTSDLTALSSIDLATQSAASSALAIIDGAIDSISNIRSNFGATENRLFIAIDNLESSSVSLQEAKGQIMDTDFAEEMTNFSKLQILQQAGTAMLAHANANPQSVLKLFQ